MAFWSTKAAISLKRVKTEKKLLWAAYRNSLSLFRTVPPATTYTASLPRDWGFAPHPKLQSLLSQERVKLRTSNLARTIIGSVRIKGHEKLWRKGSVGVSRDCPNFLGTPIISGTGKATDFKFGQYIQTVHPNKRPLKFLEKIERGRIHGLPNFFGYPYYISATGKATKFKFCMHIYRLNRNKSPLKISGNIAVGVLGDSKNSQGTHYRPIARITRSSLR